jgi:hypothetical protein
MSLFWSRARARKTFCGLWFIAAAATGHAQLAPTGPGLLPLTQQGTILGDSFDSNPLAALDVVGDKNTPGAYVGSDADYMYFRLRIAGSPYKTAVHHYYPDLWACLLDIDQNPQTYELLAGVDGTVVPNTVDLQQNTATATADDVSDQTESTLVTYDAALNSQYASSGSSLGGAVDFFFDWQVAWTDLTAAGLSPGKPFRLVCGTSTSATSLSGGDVLDGGSGSKSFSADASDAVLCDANGCIYDAVFKDGFEGN